MSPSTRTTLIVAVTLAMTGLAGTAQALEEGTTEQMRPFVSGGVSLEEVKSLESQRLNYQLWLVTLDKVSGAWLAGAQVAIRDAKGALVLETKLDGPYLFVDLLPGRYSIDATLEGATQSSSLHVTGRGLRQVLARFDTGVAVSPEMPEHPLAKALAADPETVQSVK